MDQRCHILFTMATLSHSVGNNFIFNLAELLNKIEVAFAIYNVWE